jgi:hypothetical protein
MGYGKKVIAGAATIAMVAFAGVAALQARAVGRKASGVRAGMSFAEVSRQLDGWAMINAHPLGRGTQNRAKPGPEYFGYSGEVDVLTPVEPDGRETSPREPGSTKTQSRGRGVAADQEVTPTSREHQPPAPRARSKDARTRSRSPGRKKH